MTTLENVTLEQILALSTEAGQHGDLEMVADCTSVYDAYLASDCPSVPEAIDHDRGAVRDAARRIVEALNYAEGMSE